MGYIGGLTHLSRHIRGSPFVEHGIFMGLTSCTHDSVPHLGICKLLPCKFEVVYLSAKSL